MRRVFGSKSRAPARQGSGLSFYTGEEYEARCERLAQKPGETYEAWKERMAEEMRRWAEGYKKNQ